MRYMLGHRRRRDVHRFRRLRPRHRGDRGLEGACRCPATRSTASCTGSRSYRRRDATSATSGSARRSPPTRCSSARAPTVAYVTTRGFRDVPFIQRGNRKYHYDMSWVKPKPLVKRRHCFEIDERIDAYGEVLDRARRGRACARSPRRSAADAGDRGGRRLPAVLLHQPGARAAGEGDLRRGGCRTCRSRSPTTCCRNGRSTSAPRPRSPTPTSSRSSAGSLRAMRRRLDDERRRRRTSSSSSRTAAR